MIEKLRYAIDSFVEHENELLIQDSHEASITGCLVHYLAKTFNDFEYDIDTQYNKRILDNQIVSKQMEFLIYKLPLHKWPRNWDNNQETMKKELLPDIIFHNRKSSDQNFLVIEVKKTTNKNTADREWDLMKLREMTSRDLHYKYGAFIDFTAGEEYVKQKPYSLIIFENGEIQYED